MPSKSRTTTANVATPASRVYVLDTNVLLHDPAALFAFEEHDVIVPMVVLEELDRHKKGVADLARNARQVTRSLDELLPHGSMESGFALEGPSNGRATGRLFFKESEPAKGGKAGGLEVEKADNLILAVAREMLKAQRDAVLVTKDINLRVKALATGVPAQDYRNDRVFSDTDVLPTGFINATDDLWAIADEGEVTFRKGNRSHVRITKTLPLNSFVVEPTTGDRIRLWRVVENDGGCSELAQVHRDARSGTESLIDARNEGQSMALNLLFDQDIDALALLGVAGTGKTLMALAAGLEQVREGRYEGVIITRATVPMGEEIGFLPGDEAEKMGAWLGGTLEDCFEVLQANDKLKEQVAVKSMSFMRGRSFQNKFIIIDEAQNLTPHQMRGLLTRAGEGTKVVVTGNLAQIDTPYLDEGSSGLTWAVKTLQNWKHSGHVILPRGERSRLATFIEEAASSDAKQG